MGEEAIFNLRKGSHFGFCVFWGDPYGQKEYQLNFYIPFVSLSIVFKKKTADNRWFSIA